MSDTARDIGIGVAIGALLGLAIGYITAPQSGTATRHWISERADVVGDQVKRVSNRIRRRGEEKEEELAEVEA